MDDDDDDEEDLFDGNIKTIPTLSGKLHDPPELFSSPDGERHGYQEGNSKSYPHLQDQSNVRMSGSS